MFFLYFYKGVICLSNTRYYVNSKFLLTLDFYIEPENGFKVLQEILFSLFKTYSFSYLILQSSS